MIQVVIPPEIQFMMSSLAIPTERVVQTVNDRHQGMTDEGVSRMFAARWFPDGQIIYVDSSITKRQVEETRVRIDEVRILLAIALRPMLPTGPIDRDTPMEKLSAHIAESFGHPLTFHESEPPNRTYHGPWDRTPPRIAPQTGQPGRSLLLLATLNADMGTAMFAYAFDPHKYMAWLSKT